MTHPMNLDNKLLVRALVYPESLLDLTARAWDTLLPMAQHAGILARIGIRLDEVDALVRLPPRVRDQLEDARVVAVERKRIMCWEVNRIRRALAPLQTPVVLLKGAAYAAANLPPARGRLSSDIDVMVPKATISATEQLLLRHGWEHVTLDRYDQRYYRTWMHELPPLRHRKRQTILDVHHTILPESGRLRPDPQLLFDEAKSIDGLSMIQILSPTDMVLHSAAHLFQDGEFHNALRDLADLDDLLSDFGRQPDFWNQLVPRALQLNLERPLFYALRYTKLFLNTPVAAPVTVEAKTGKPIWPIPPVMDKLIAQAFIGHLPHRKPLGIALAQWLLYVRAHWLRMPPPLLAKHLFRKAFRWKSAVCSDDSAR